MSENTLYGEGIVRLASCVAVWRQSEVSIDFKKALRAWSFSAERSLNQPKATRVWIRSIDQSNRSISVRLLFLFCSRAFISRSYENRFIRIKSFVQTANLTGHFVHMEPFNKFPLCSYELWTARQCKSTTRVKRLSGVGSCHRDFQTNQKSGWANIMILDFNFFKALLQMIVIGIWPVRSSCPTPGRISLDLGKFQSTLSKADC